MFSRAGEKHAECLAAAEVDDGASCGTLRRASGYCTLSGEKLEFVKSCH